MAREEISRENLRKRLKEIFGETAVYEIKETDWVSLADLKVEIEGVDLDNPLNHMVEVPCYIYRFESPNGGVVAKWWNNTGLVHSFAVSSNSVREHFKRESEFINDMLESI